MTYDQEREHNYQVQERLGILCGTAEPTPEQVAIAKAEADEWVRLDDERQGRTAPARRPLRG